MVPSSATQSGSRRQSARQLHGHPPQGASAASAPVNDELFLEPMMGTPLSLYVDKDVPDKELLVEQITKRGGTVSKGYSNVPYILVNPHTESGQSLYRQYAGKKGKIILSYRWVNECINKNELQTYATNWAGCKVTGNEPTTRPTQNAISAAPPAEPPPAHPPPTHAANAPPRNSRREVLNLHTVPPSAQAQAQQTTMQLQTRQAEQQHSRPEIASHSPVYSQQQAIQAASAALMTPATPLGHHQPFAYGMYPPSNAQHVGRPPILPPPQTWQQPTPITPHQNSTHVNILPRPHMDFGREDQWHASGSSFPHIGAPPETHNLPALAAGNNFYDQRFRDDQNGWTDANHDFYDSTTTGYENSYAAPVEPYPPHVNGGSSEIPADPGPSSGALPAPAPQSTVDSAPGSVIAPAREVTPPPRERGRKRLRTPPEPAPPPSSLVVNKRWRSARSPTPPTRVIKSTYGGNLFTADDVMYLKKYIDYCQEQGLVLSLREICERVALKAPHHTFYSWRRYCNKHQIRLGGYAMAETASPPPPTVQEIAGEAADGEEAVPLVGDGPFTINDAELMYHEKRLRNRSPTPPRALFRSTTGKGIAFTPEDVTFLCKYMAYRKVNNNLDMIAFWKDVAEKAPHHSRASWMKYYRRHKHELNRSSTDEPLPMRPAKKLRYHRKDDVLLARFFATKPEGTLDKIFQNFAKIHSYHPWKGWQEHYRLHKTMIDHIITQINNGETIDIEGEEE